MLNYNKNKLSSQQGVTLLLAILILSAVMSISFSLATILFVEVRSSNDLLKTEPAFFGANGVAEEAVFNIKRNVCGGSSCTYTNTYTNNVTTPTSPVINLTTNPVFQDKIPPATNFSSAKIYPYYNPIATNPSVAGSGYGRITVTYLDTGNTNPLHVYLCQFDPTKAVDPTGATPSTYNTTACSSASNTVVGYGDSYWTVANSIDFQMTPNGTTESHSWDIDPTLQQQLILFNPSTSGTNIFVKIESFGSGPTYSPNGIPYAGITAVDVNASNGAVNRKIRVVVPNTGGSAASTPTNISQGKTATQISTFPGLVAGNAVDGNTNGAYPTDGISHTNGGATDWWEVDLGATYNVSSVVIWNRTDCCMSRLTDYYVYVSGGTDYSYNQTSYPNPSSTITTSGASGRYVRVRLSGSSANNFSGYYLQLAEVQVFGTSGSAPVVNHASSGTVSVSSQYSSNFPASAAINGNRTGEGWGSGTGGWNDSIAGSFPDWLQVDFAGAKSISEIDVYTLPDGYPVTPTISTSAALDGIRDFQIQYDNGSGWQTVSGGNVTGNTLAWRRFAFPTISNVTKIRVYITGVNATNGAYSRIVELEAY